MHRFLKITTVCIGLLFAVISLPAAAQQSGFPAFTSVPGPDGATTYTLGLQTFILLTSLTFIPAVVLMMTSFTRIIIVLSLLRMALGTQSSPPNQVLIGLALFLSFFIMSPVIDRVYNEAYLPFSEDKIDIMQAAEIAGDPLRTFMLHQTRESDLALFAQISDHDEIEGPEQVPFKILVPAYITSELKTAFQIGFIIFIPFLIIDMVVASVLMSMGMMMLSPMIISLPFKLMLFVLVDGWHLLIGSLTQSFYV
ncbi:MAG: flagellar type III secretion system pore protein FliP [Nitrosomonas sp.]|nr:flagellar type III secretion system pore protein FliP [Nitrosomonas sp.]MCP5250559.1 flagellar type III secretion system pore protein FliP [Burkholderiales bacterium]MCP5292952.1 flagellar type III secretion system pore protein FliP [Burkholderiales bacterium]MDR4519139.1 flagellar type III secretion system pore protein FliP [Nitrosomonas sp.]HQU61901.1 flagellar type III secretion system pore protein FliP [Nitrosomonas sp.]